MIKIPLTILRTCTSMMVITILVCNCSKSSISNSDPGKTKPPPTDSSASDQVIGTVTYHEGDYTLIYTNNDPDFDTSIRTKMVNTFFVVYPKEAGRFNSGSTKTVTFVMDKAYSGVAATGGDRTTFSAAYFKNNPNDIDVVTHEVMHIVQSYPQYNPVWLVEGIADYARYTYGLHNTEEGWTLPLTDTKQSYKDSYQVTARFLVWLEQHSTNKIVDVLNAALHSNNYTDNTWVETTGKTVDQLWADYSLNPGLLQDSVPIGGGVDITYGAKLSVSQENSGGAGAKEGSSKLIDNDITSKFFIANFVSGLSMQLKMSAEKVADTYVLTSGNDDPDRDPKNWILLASNNNADWVQLDSRNNQTFQSRNMTKRYSMDNSTAYLYYKLVVSENNGSPDFQLSEWRLLTK